MLEIFVVPLIAQSLTGTRAYKHEPSDHGGATVSMLGFLGTRAFWCQSFQTWRSEFPVVDAHSLPSIFLRQMGSPWGRRSRSPSPARTARPARPDDLS